MQIPKNHGTVAFAPLSASGNNIHDTGKAFIAEKGEVEETKMESSACGDG